MFFPPTASSNDVPNLGRNNSNGAIAAPSYRSAASPASAHRARSWPRQRRICYKAEHTATGTNLRFLITNGSGRASEVFAFYNDRGECENRIEEFKNGFRAERLSCHRFLANAFRLLLYGFAYNLVNLFRQHLPQPWRSAQIETLRAQLVQTRRSHPPDRPLPPGSPGHRLAVSSSVPQCHAGL